VKGETLCPVSRNLGAFSLKGIDGLHELFEILPYCLKGRVKTFPDLGEHSKGIVIGSPRGSDEHAEK